MPQSGLSLKMLKPLACAALLALASATGAQAATYPDKPITLIVPYPPGGTTDIAARAVAHVMEGELKEPIIIENRAGAGGMIGMGLVAHAKPDGYTLGLGTIGTQSINQFIYKNMPYNPSTAFVPIALVITTPNVIAVSAKSKIKTLGDLIATAKARDAKGKSDRLSFASPGVGSSVHLTGVYFEQEAGIHMLHVPFKGGAESMPAVTGGHVDVLFDNLPSSLAQIKSGERLRGLAVTSAKRSPALPDLPTVAESGVPGFDVIAWFGLWAPKGTPQPVIDKLIAASKTALKSPKLEELFAKQGAEAGHLFGADLGAFVNKERQRWSKLIKDRHIQTQ
ncbi:Bug family tripartite tricarboxylate transporter substrate binding protein [Candidimonas nitroreducens]|uniref:ABC transporter substrate-binding protein n=1 Tax=Candidimonas nitroreducens TaxID=683354 RepID=A0A225MR36_9BURK|nr:ABC transporter substrate-binding protein [Candidimonas nitroreducens]